LEILKLLVNFNRNQQLPIISESSSLDQPKVYTGGINGQKYTCMFDLNSRDVNDQSGLHTAVIGNKYEICEYLLNLRVKQLSEHDLNQIEHEKNKAKSKLKTTESNNSISLFTSLLSSLSNDDINQNITSNSGGGGSFFDQLKNVFLDSKPQPEPHIETAIPPVLIEPEISYGENKSQDDIYFSPINVNSYSKFGSTCLHEAIRFKNYSLVNLLLTNGADANLPIYDMNSTPNEIKKDVKSKPKNILSNCLCEAIKQLDEHMFLLVLDHVDYNEFDFKIIYKLCIELMNTKNDARLNPAQGESLSLFGKKMISYMMQLKIVNDSEFKINIRNKLSSKHLTNLIGLKPNTNVNNLLGPTFDCGLILNWNNLDPKMVKIYESWLHNSTKYFKFSNKNLNLNNPSSQVGASTQAQKDNSNQPHTLSMKKLHFHVITRVDFSCNNLEQLPFALFQIESLKFMKLSFNSISNLPSCRNYELDDVNKLNIPLDIDSHVNWNCNMLEELELDNNKLTVLPAQLFFLKSLKHLNVSNNL
jgi:hypothetical protein